MGSSASCTVGLSPAAGVMLVGSSASMPSSSAALNVRSSAIKFAPTWRKSTRRPPNSTKRLVAPVARPSCGA